MRRRLAAVLLLALVGAGLFGGSLAALTGARRSSTALDRFLSYSRPETVFVVPSEDVPLDMAAVDAMPEVLATNYQSYLAMAPVEAGRDPNGATVGSINPYLRTPLTGPTDALLRPRIIRGRDLNPARPNEAVVDEELARARNLAPGSHLSMATFTMEQMADLFAPQVPAPDGPVVDLLITGVVRTPADLIPGGAEARSFGSSMDLYLSPAFYPRWGEDLAVFGPPVVGSGHGVLLRRGTLDLPRFEQRVRSLPGGEDAVFAVGASDLLDAARAARRAISVETTALLALGVALAVAGSVLLAQGVARLARGTVADLTVVRSVGGRPVALLLLAAGPGVTAVALSVVGAAAVAIALSPLTPIGLGRMAEITPGVHVDALVLGAGCFVLLSIGLVASVAFAARTVQWLAPRFAARAAQPSRFVARLGSLGAPLSSTLGASLAIERSGQRRVPLRYAGVAGALAMLVVGGVASYTASLDHLVRDRTQQGATWDLTLGNPNGSDFSTADQARLLAYPSVAAATAVVSPEMRGTVNGRELSIAGIDALAGSVGPVVTTGRLPTAPGEIAVGRRTAASAHAKVGDRVEVKLDGARARMTVVGIAVLNPGLAFSMEIGDGAVVSIEQIRRLLPDAPVSILLVGLRPGTVVADAVESLELRFANVQRPAVAVEVLNLRRVRSLPIALAAAMAVAALLLLIFAVIVSTRERRRELGVLRAVGATRQQVGAVVVWQGVWIFLAALIGLPLGVAAGRVVWDTVVSSMGTPAPAEVPYEVLAAVVMSALCLVLVIGGVQAAFSGRGPAALGLRSE